MSDADVRESVRALEHARGVREVQLRRRVNRLLRGGDAPSPPPCKAHRVVAPQTLRDMLAEGTATVVCAFKDHDAPLIATQPASGKSHPQFHGRNSKCAYFEATHNTIEDPTQEKEQSLKGVHAPIGPYCLDTILLGRSRTKRTPPLPSARGALPCTLAPGVLWPQSRKSACEASA